MSLVMVGAAAVALREAGWRGSGQQVGHGAPDGVLRRPAQQPLPALAPAAHHAVRVHHKRGSAGILLAGHVHAPRLRPDSCARQGWFPATSSSLGPLLLDGARRWVPTAAVRG